AGGQHPVDLLHEPPRPIEMLEDPRAANQVECAVGERQSLAARGCSEEESFMSGDRGCVWIDAEEAKPGRRIEREVFPTRADVEHPSGSRSDRPRDLAIKGRGGLPARSHAPIPS